MRVERYHLFSVINGFLFTFKGRGYCLFEVEPRLIVFEENYFLENYPSMGEEVLVDD
jgi:hypothetical protein